MKSILVFLKLLLMHSSMVQLKSQPVKASAGNLSCYFIYQHVTWFQVFVSIFEALCHRGFAVAALSECPVPCGELCTVLHLQCACAARKSAVLNLYRAGWNQVHIPARIHTGLKKKKKMLVANQRVSNFNAGFVPLQIQLLCTFLRES